MATINEVRQDTCGEAVFDEYALSVEDMRNDACTIATRRAYLVTRVADYLRLYENAQVLPDDRTEDDRLRTEPALPLLGGRAAMEQHGMGRVVDGECDGKTGYHGPHHDICVKCVSRGVCGCHQTCMEV